LENRKSKDDKVFRGMWKTVEIKVGEAWVAETKERREKKRREKETRRERIEKEVRK